MNVCLNEKYPPTSGAIVAEPIFVVFSATRIIQADNSQSYVPMIPFTVLAGHRKVTKRRPWSARDKISFYFVIYFARQSIILKYVPKKKKI